MPTTCGGGEAGGGRRRTRRSTVLRLAGTRGAAKRQARLGLAVTEPRRGAGIQRCDAGHAFGEGDALTEGGVTKKAAHVQPELDGHQGPGQIGQGAAVATMHAMGRLVTIGADGLGSGHRGHEREVVVLEEKRFKVQMCIRGEEVRAQFVQHHRYSPLRIENERRREAWEHLECTSVGSMSSGQGGNAPSPIDKTTSCSVLLC